MKKLTKLLLLIPLLSACSSSSVGYRLDNPVEQNVCYIYDEDINATTYTLPAETNYYIKFNIDLDKFKSWERYLGTNPYSYYVAVFEEGEEYNYEFTDIELSSVKEYVIGMELFDSKQVSIANTDENYIKYDFVGEDVQECFYLKIFVAMEADYVIAAGIKESTF